MNSVLGNINKWKVKHKTVVMPSYFIHRYDSCLFVPRIQNTLGIYSMGNNQMYQKLQEMCLKLHSLSVSWVCFDLYKQHWVLLMFHNSTKAGDVWKNKIETWTPDSAIHFYVCLAFDRVYVQLSQCILDFFVCW